MEVSALSPSKLERLRLCEARVESQLHDEGYEEEKGEPALIGTLAHECAKLWYRKGVDGSWLYAELGDAFRAAMNECTNRQGRGSELPREASSIQAARTLAEQIATHYKRDGLNIIFAERRYKGNLSNAVPVHLIIDLGVDRGVDSHGNRTLEIIDYKTGFIACTTEDMYDKDQVLMNLLAVSLDPEYATKFTSFHFTYFWVKLGYETGPISFDGERLKDYEHWLGLEYKRIKEIKEPTESLNRFCASCGRRNDCKKYREWMTEALAEPKLLTLEEMSVLDDEVLMVQHQKLKGQMDKLEKLRDGLGDHLNSQLTVRQTDEITGKNYKAVRRSSQHDSYSVQTVLALCQAHHRDPASVLSVKKKGAEEMFASNPEAMQQLTLTMKKGRTAPSLQVVQIGVKRKTQPKKKAGTPEGTREAPVIQPAPGTSPLGQSETPAL
jgi:hypothetical protein